MYRDLEAENESRLHLDAVTTDVEEPTHYIVVARCWLVPIRGTCCFSQPNFLFTFLLHVPPAVRLAVF